MMNKNFCSACGKLLGTGVHTCSPQMAIREITALRAELAEAKKDAERLNYLQNTGSTISIVLFGDSRDFGFCVGGLPKTNNAVLREAIDAAMQGETK